MAKARSDIAARRQTFIRHWRKHRGLTLDQLSGRVGVTPGAISQLERGIVSYTQPMLEALADALSCEPADLLTRDPAASETLWSVYREMQPDQRSQAIEILRTLIRTSKK